MSSFLQLQVSVWHSFHLNSHKLRECDTSCMLCGGVSMFICALEQQSVEQSENHFLFLWLTALLLLTQLPLFTHWPAYSISAAPLNQGGGAKPHLNPICILEKWKIVCVSALWFSSAPKSIGFLPHSPTFMKTGLVVFFYSLLVFWSMLDGAKSVEMSTQ